jgi:hypothetical protein
VRWVSGSKRRALSSTSPKKSSRTGCVAPGAKMSMIPPRTAKSPGSTTVEAREKPIRASQAVSASMSTWRPASAVKLAPATVSGVGTRCEAALRVVTSTAGRSHPCAMAARVAIRVAAISGFGETRSYGRQSHAGSGSTGSSGAKMASASVSAAARASSRATWITGPEARATISATSFASHPSGAPQTVTAPGAISPCVFMRGK